MDNDNKQVIIEKIWEDPERVFGGEWRLKGKAWQTQRGAIRLLRTASGANISVWGNHNSGFAGQRIDVFTYLQENRLHTADFFDTLKRCADLYGVDLKLSKEQAEKIQRQRLAREIAPSLVSALMEDRGGEVCKYIANVRGLEPDGEHFGQLTDESIERAKESLKARGYDYDPADFEALKITTRQAGLGYRLVLPYHRNGEVVGFLFRDVTGTATHKYDTPADMERGYCDRLSDGEMAYFVEGELDAVRLIQAGFHNVVSMGGAQINDTVTRLMDTHGIHQITYIPDLEYDDSMVKETKITSNSIKAFQAASVNGRRVITHLYVAEIPTPEDMTKYPKFRDGKISGYKIDTDTYGKEHGAEGLRELCKGAMEWWDYELSAFDAWANGTLSDGGTLNRWDFENRFMAIYNRCASPLERERIRQNIKGVTLYEQNGITPAALSDVDAMKRHSEYNDRVRECAQAMNKAAEEGANPATIGDLLAKMAEIQGTNNRDEWEQQLNATFADELNDVRERPDTLRTKWEVGNLVPNRRNPAMLDFMRYETVEYYPADITVYCAPTSHGKTMILFQSALDLVKDTDKTFLYVSVEENKRQLLERAMNVYIDIPTTEGGRDSLNNYTFIQGTRKKAIRAALCGYRPEQYDPDHWQNLCARILAGVERYGEKVRPRLKLIHTEGSAESIAENVRHYVEQYRAQGVDVGGVFVDYMQLLTSDGGGYSRHDELKDVCKALKGCAEKTELPVIIAAQLNRYAIADGLDSVTVANIAEAADIERIAHDIYLIWQVDKTKKDLYYKNQYPDGDKNKTQEPKRVLNYEKMGERSRRIFKKTGSEEIELKTGYLYVEQLKAREGKTEGWALFPFNGEQGTIGTIDTNIMRE